MGSWVEPASTRVKNEKTGASGRSQMITVRPLGSFLTVTRFSNEATSWAAVKPAKTTRITHSCRVRLFIEPPSAGLDFPDKTYLLTAEKGRSLKLRVWK